MTQTTGMSALMSRISELFADTSPSKIKNIIIIDAMNMFMRSFHMINHVDSDGDHVGGLAGFLKSVGAMIKFHHPSEVYVVFDGEAASSTKRLLYPDYKGNRKLTAISKPLLYSSKEAEREAIYNQAVRAANYCKLLPLKAISIDNMEADDVIGAMVKKFNDDESVDEVTLITEDGDYLQLINHKTKVYFPIKKKFATKEYVLERYACHPNNFGIYKALIGDKSDNIPKVPQLGEKTLAKMFPFLKEEHPYDLDDIYQVCIDRVNAKDDNKLYAKVLGLKSQIDINYKLVNLAGIQFFDKDLALIDELIASDDLVFDPEMFMRLYNADGLVNSILNVRVWLNECFKHLIKK